MEAEDTDRMRELAMRIYVELVARNTELADGSVKMSATASNIATLSFRLSEAFLTSEAEAVSARQPRKGYQLGAEDIAKWSR